MAPKPRPSWALLAVAFPLLAGCLGAAPGAYPAAEPSPLPVPPSSPEAAPPAAPLPYEGAGEVFLPPSMSQEREVTALAFPVNATGMDGLAELRLGSRMVAEGPAVLADVVVDILDTAGEVVASAQLTFASPQATLDLPELAAGTHQLVLRSYGGSDGESFGDYVAWHVRVA